MDKSIGYFELWEYVKFELGRAVDIGHGQGYDFEGDDGDRGRFEAYRFILDLMDDLERRNL